MTYVWDDSEAAHRGGLLFEETLDRTRSVFEGYGHSLNEDQWKGIEAIAGAYAGMAVGTAKPKNYLSQLATGIGKTTVAIQATKALLSNPDFKDVSIIYFLSRLDEIRRLVEDMGLSRNDFACLTSDKELNEEGRWEDPWNARVLFTTQQKLERRSTSISSFAEIEEFLYRGKPRQVRIWDEAILPSKALVVSGDTLDSLKKGLRQPFPELTEAIEDFARSLKGHEGEIVKVIDIDAYDGPKEGFDLGEFRSYHSDGTDQNTAEALHGLSGRTARIRRDNRTGLWTVEYADILPDDLKPMLILDASGGLRHDYSMWKEYRKDLERLPAAEKSFEGFTIHHLDAASGTGVYRSHTRRGKLADYVAKILSEIPTDEDVLIVTHKPKGVIDIQKDLLKRIPTDRKVSFIHYGNHKATNAHKDVRYMIHVGLFIFPDAQYEANGRGAMRADVNRVLTKEEFTDIRMGEISDHIFQAAGRGAIRKCVGGKCPPGCHLYMIFSTHKVTGFPRGQLSVIFPGAAVEAWNPDDDSGPTRLTGQTSLAAEFIASVVLTGGTVTTDEVREALGGMAASHFSRMINRDDFKSAMRDTEITLEPGHRGKPGQFRKVTTATSGI